MDLEYELQLFQAKRLSELEAEKLNKERQKNVNILSNQFLDCLSTVVVNHCSECKEKAKAVCKHWYPEDLQPFWLLRSVCKEWKNRINNWLRSRKMILIHGKSIKKHRLNIIEEGWEIDKIKIDRNKNAFVKQFRPKRKPLWNSIKWYRFLTTISFKYGITIQIHEAPICDAKQANDKITQMQAEDFERKYKGKAQRKKK